MKSATTIADASALGDPRDSVFDIYRVYAETLLNDPKREQETGSRQGYFHPSSLGMCARKNVYEARGEPFKIHLGVQDLETFNQGHYVHDRIQSVMEQAARTAKKQGLVWRFEREVPYDRTTDRLFADLRCGGTCDGELWVEKPGEWVQHSVIEGKSMKNEYWVDMKRPKDDHLLQAHLYAFRFNAPIIYFWYFNKNTGQHRVFPWVFDKEIFDKAIDRLVMFNEHLDAGTLPAREESWFMCNRCEYRDACKPMILKSKTTRGTPGQKKKRSKKSFGRAASKPAPQNAQRLNLIRRRKKP